MIKPTGFTLDTITRAQSREIPAQLMEQPVGEGVVRQAVDVCRSVHPEKQDTNKSS